MQPGLTLLRRLGTGLLVLVATMAAGGDALSLEEQIRAYKALPVAQRQELQRRWEDFRKRPEDERREIREHHERLARLDRDERRRFKRHFASFHRLSREKRKHLRSLHRRKERFMREVLASLPDQERTRLQGLPPHLRREAMRRLFTEALVQRRLRDLPEETARGLASKLSGKSFEERIKAVRRACHEHRGRRGRSRFRGSPGGFLLMRHGREIAGEIRASRQAGESPEQLASRLDALILRLEPKLDADKRHSAVEHLVRGADRILRGPRSGRRRDGRGRRPGPPDGHGRPGESRPGDGSKGEGRPGEGSKGEGDSRRGPRRGGRPGRSRSRGL